jgi:gliding motility-associated-like protein
MNYFLSSLFALAISASAYSQLTIDNTSNNVNQLVDGILIPTGSVQSVSNINFLGVYNVSNRYQIGYFSTATTTQTHMGFTDGIVLTSGNTSEIPLALGTDPGSVAQMSRNYVSCTVGEVRQGGSCPTYIQDLDVLCGNTNYFNAAVLEFDFVPISTTVQFRYIFGSEEYSDDGGFINYQCSDYNDKFGFLISGPGITGGQGFENDARNIARLANGSEVSINAVNNGVVGSSGGSPNAANCLSANPDWVQNVSTAEYLGTIDGTQLNGNTVILTAFQSGLTPGATYHIRLMVTDVFDGAYDAVVYLEAGSFTTELGCINPAAPLASVTAQPNCTTPTGTITVSSPANGAGVTYQIVGTNPVVSAQTNSTGIFSDLAPGEYEVTVTVDGCSSSATPLTVNGSPTTPEAPLASVTAQPNCTTPTGTITVSSPANGAGVTYQIVGTNPVVSAQTNSTGIFSDLAPGEYEVTVTVDGCSSDAIDLQIDGQPASPQVSVSASNSVVSAGTAVTLTAQGDGDFLWSTGEQTLSIEVNPTESTEYCVQLTDENGCQSEACVTIDVSIACGDLFVPTAFSPNGDGNNDYFQVLINPICVDEMVLRVFNRWGEVIFETEQITEKWNGEYKGEPVNTGIFVYTLEIKLVNEDWQRIAGNVTVIR